MPTEDSADTVAAGETAVAAPDGETVPEGKVASRQQLRRERREARRQAKEERRAARSVGRPVGKSTVL